MTKNQNQESQLQVYPQYIQPYPVEDEISLVDLWISLVKFRKIFMLSFFVLLALAVVVISVFKSEKYNMTTTLSIGQVENDGTIKELQSPSAVLNNVNSSILPRLTKEMAEKHATGLFKTSVSNPKGTNLITIVNKVTESNQQVMASFQQALAQSIISEHDELYRAMSATKQQQLESEKIALQELKNPRQLIKLSEFNLTRLEDEKIKLFQFSDKEYIENVISGYTKGLDLLNSRLAKLNRRIELLDPQLKLLGDDRVDQLQRVQILNTIAESEIAINDAEQKLLKLSQELANFQLNTPLKAEKLRKLVDSLKSEIELIESNWKARIKEKESEVSKLASQMQGNRTRVIGSADLSLGPVGLSKKSAYVISLFLALFGAFFITLLAMFRQKVNEKLAEEA